MLFQPVIEEFTMNQASSQIPADVRERVIAAAAELYQQAGRERFPTVDAVRRLSRADMNSVTVLMREWRQSQTTQAAPVAVMIPDAVQQANAAAVAAMWTQATELANQSLRTAQAAWEAERQDLDDMRSELATGYEVQAAELDAAKSQLADIVAALDVANGQLADNAAKLAAAVERANTAEARAVEIEHRANDLNAALVEERKSHASVIKKAEQETADLRSQLAAAVAELATAKAKAEAADQSHQEQRKAAAAETHQVTARMAKLEADQDIARKEAAAAREEAAKLRGHVEAMQTQNADLMRALADKQADPKSKAKPAKEV